MPFAFGYCTNVHAGADLAQTRANLERYAVAVKQRFCPNEPLGIGLWLSASAARSLRHEGGLPEFAAWLRAAGLVPFTLNGFPYGDFHQAVVKQQVYLPTWADPKRLAYTRDLIAIHDALLPPEQYASISTLPLLWGNPPPNRDTLSACARALKQVAAELAALEQTSGRTMCLCLEPEPGCVLEYSSNIVDFFKDYLWGDVDEAQVRKHLGVCHDVCHAVVMCEEQTKVLQRYRAAGLRVGKIQVSSAVILPADADRDAGLAQLATFNEPRYLHQTTIHGPKLPFSYIDDLPLAFAALEGLPYLRRGEWRTHFHVPIYIERFGHLRASQTAILECLRTAQAWQLTEHYEVETYAWGVLPQELQQPDLAAGIAEELRWFRERFVT